MTTPTRFNGTERYVATEDLKTAVNAALILQRPLLIKGEPGTGKTRLAEEVAAVLGRDLIQWHIKSTSTAQQGLHEHKGALWQAFESETPTVVLIDEIDKADIDFPNDLLQEIDRMEFHVHETQQTITAVHRPLIIITSNNEKELPDAFLRRCFFHYIRFPDRETLESIVQVHYPQLSADLLRAALQRFYELRQAQGLKKKPSTSELLDWIYLLLHENKSAEDIETANTAKTPLIGALIKNEHDMSSLARIAKYGR